MKATELLKKQHRTVKSLFKRALGESDAQARRDCLREITTALKGHTTIEEHHLYPAIQALGSKKAESMAMEAYEEHHVVDLVLAELPSVDVEDERYEAKVTVLKELVEHHVEEEEEEMFKLAEKLGDDELKALGRRMQDEFESLAQGDRGDEGERRGRAHTDGHAERHA